MAWTENREISTEYRRASCVMSSDTLSLYQVYRSPFWRERSSRKGEEAEHTACWCRLPWPLGICRKSIGCGAGMKRKGRKEN